MGRSKGSKLIRSSISSKHDRPKSKIPESKKTIDAQAVQSNKRLKVEGKPQSKAQAQHSQPIIPFDVYDNILLVGEGDLSFTASLLLDHGCTTTLTTTYDSATEILEKYPHASTHIQTIKDTEQTLLHSIDATKLSSPHQPQSRLIKNRAPFDRIIFNFPHVGGKSTDVNRQVRANQALLAGFFAAALPLLADEGSILVTLFEGEPYTLWNIRDLARHVELVVKRSWRFQASEYPVYRHARTLGVVKQKGTDGEESETAWRGEARAARTYEFGKKGAVGEVRQGIGKKRRAESEDDNDEDD